MLTVKRIVSIWKQKYNGTEYPVIEAEVIIDDDDVSQIEDFGPESLGKALCPDGTAHSREAYDIDCQIYAYVPDSLHHESHEDIIAYIEKEID